MSKHKCTATHKSLLQNRGKAELTHQEVFVHMCLQNDKLILESHKSGNYLLDPAGTDSKDIHVPAVQPVFVCCKTYQQFTRSITHVYQKM